MVSQNAEQLVEEHPVQDFLNSLEFIPGCGNCEETNVKDWIEMDSNDQVYQIQDDDEIVRIVTEVNTSNAAEEEECDMECTEEERACPSHAEVLDMLIKCLPWVEQQPETTPIHIFVYRHLLEIAAEKENPKSSSIKNHLIFSSAH